MLRRLTRDKLTLFSLSSQPHILQPASHVLSLLYCAQLARPSAALGPHKLGHKKEPQLPAEKGLQLLFIIIAPTFTHSDVE